MDNPESKVTKEVFIKHFFPIWFNLNPDIVKSGFKASGLFPPDFNAVDKTKFRDTEKKLTTPTEGVQCSGKKDVGIQNTETLVDASTQLTSFGDSFLDYFPR